MRKLFALIALLSSTIYTEAQFTQNHYLPGEKLKFILYYGLLNGGYLDAQLVETDYNGKSVYHATMVGTTTGLADAIYKVRDEYQSYFNPENALPLKSVRDISEGKYKRYDLAYFDHKNLKVVNSKNKEFKVPPDIRDMVAVFYYVRNLDFSRMKYDDVIKINTFFDNDLFPFDMRFRGTEVISTKLGDYQCIKLVPYVEPGRIFTKEDDMIIYLSDDRNRVPIRIEFTLKIGSVKCDLIEYSGLKY